MNTASLRFRNLWNGSAAAPPLSRDYCVDVTFSMDTGDMLIKFVAPFHDDPRPTAPAGRLDHLWDHEVVELFVGPGAIHEDELEYTPYLEIEIGPHGHWYICMFPGQADFYNKTDDLQLEKAPVVHIDREKREWTASMVIPSFMIPEPDSKDDLEIAWTANAFAIHGVGEQRTYHAYSKCPGEKPNFHQLQSFRPLVLQELDMNNLNMGSNSSSSNSSNSSNSNSIGSSSGSDKAVAPVIKPFDLPPLQKKKTIKTLKFSNSTVDQDNSKRLIAEIEALRARQENESASGGGAFNRQGSRVFASKDKEYFDCFIDMNAEQRSRASTRIPSVLEISEAIRDRHDLPQIDECFMKHVHPEEEFVVLYGMVVKRKGWSYKDRMLILTSKPRLFYLKHPSSSLIFTPKNVKYKGNIPWSIKEILNLTLVDKTNFDIDSEDKTRIYHINDKVGGSQRWFDAISAISFCWTNYYKKNMEKPGGKK